MNAGDPARQEARRSATRIALVFLVLGVLWILLSDRVVHALTPTREAEQMVQSVKGVAYVAITTAVVFVLVFQRVERLLRVEREHRRSQEEFRGAFEHAVAGMALVSPEGRLLRVNAVLAQMMGVLPPDMVGRNVMEFVHPEDRARRERYLHEVASGESPNRQFELRYVSAEGAVRWALVASAPVRDETGRAAYLVSQVVDVTARRQAEAQLAQQRDQLARASRLVTTGQMAAGLAHDLSQPVSAILQYAEAVEATLRGGRWEPQSLAAAMRDVGEQATRAATIIDRLRTAAKRQPAAPSRLSVNEQVREAVRLLAIDADRRGVQVSMQLSTADPQVSTDPVQFQQVLTNLLANAVEAAGAGKEGGREVSVETRCSDGGETVSVDVSDGGAGVPPSVAPRLFEPFATGRSRGLGLGLSTCRSLVESMGGSVRYHREDERTHFIVELPVAGGTRAGNGHE